MSTTTNMAKTDDYFYNAIKNADLAVESVNTYVYSLKRLQKYTNNTIFHAIVHPQDTFTILSAEIKVDATLSATVSVMVALFKHADMLTSHKSYFTQWYAIYEPLIRKQKDMRLSNTPTERQEQVKISWINVLSKLDNLNNTEFASRGHLVLSFYVMMAPRRQKDYWKINVYDELNNVPIDTECAAYVNLRVEKPYIVVNEFKTAKTMNTWTKELPIALVKVLKRSLLLHPRRWVFAQQDGQPYKNTVSFRCFTNALFNRWFGAGVTLDTIRHSFVTFRYQNATLSTKDHMQDALDMGHTLDTHMAYAFVEKAIIVADDVEEVKTTPIVDGNPNKTPKIKPKVKGVLKIKHGGKIYVFHEMIDA